MFNLSSFDPPDGADDYRTLEHFRSASGLVLDFDNGEVSPQEFQRIFWTEAGRGRKMSFAIMNTFSRNVSAPNKFRVVIPFRQPTRSVEEFHAAYDHIVRRIEERGYRKPPKIHDGPNLDAGGLDRSSRSPTQLFYWPCTNENHPEAAFFRSCGFQKRELERYALDPLKVAETVPVSLFEAVTPAPHERANQAKLDAVLRQWREAGVAPGNGNDEFFRLGLGLAKAGLSEHEIECKLKAEAHHAHTPKDRLRNIPHVMRGIRSRRRIAVA